jgi:hypothetical protein
MEQRVHRTTIDDNCSGNVITSIAVSCTPCSTRQPAALHHTIVFHQAILLRVTQIIRPCFLRLATTTRALRQSSLHEVCTVNCAILLLPWQHLHHLVTLQLDATHEFQGLPLCL